MTRYKGRLSSRTIERDFPFIVEMREAVLAYRERGPEVHAWYKQRGIEERGGRGFYSEPDFYVHACFKFQADAEAFTRKFGGQLLGAGILSKRPPRKRR